MNNFQELISIIMPAFNCEKYIEKSVNSVISQTYKNWELIILDDFSSDETLNIIKKLKTLDERIKVYENEKNMGVSETRNRGIELSSGEWIAFLDSDDIWDKTKLEKQYNFSKKENVDFIFTGSSYINEFGEYYKGKLNVPYKVSYKDLRKHNIISCSSVLIKKKYFSNIRMEKDSIHEDYAVWLKILKTGTLAYGIDEPLLIYRLSRKSKSGNKIKTMKMTYNVFRFVGINPISSCYFTFRHMLTSVKKYKKILLG